jgi:transcriptional regulator with XRE-family HTH domain
MSNISERLEQVRAKAGLNKSQLALKCGISTAYMSDIFNKGKQPGTEVFQTLKTSLPEINLNWLITGEGQMYTAFEKSEESLPNHPPPDNPGNKNDLIELASRMYSDQNSKLDKVLSLAESQQRVIETLSITLRSVAGPSSNTHHDNKKQQEENQERVKFRPRSKQPDDALH